MCQQARGGAVLYAREADLAWITLRRPEALNALNAEMLLTGETIDAEEAWRIGLVNRVVERDRLRSEAERLARSVTAHAPAAVRMTWEALHRGLNLTLEESALLGADFFGHVASTSDFREGTRAFLEGARPSFRGR
jgi:enoyl-CoA hydratase